MILLKQVLQWNTLWDYKPSAYLKANSVEEAAETTIPRETPEDIVVT